MTIDSTSQAAPSSELRQREQIIALSQFFHAAGSVKDLLVGGQKRLFDFFGVERATLFALDTRSSELFSVTGNEFKEIRVRLGVGSIAGFVGITKRSLNIQDVYDQEELARIDSRLTFDRRWDKASGFRTREVLCVPVLNDGNLLGVLQLINHKDQTPFSARDEAAAQEIAKSLGLAFYNLNRLHTLRQARKPSRWDALVDSGAITENALQEALREAAAAGVDPARYLVEHKKINRADVERSLSSFYNCEFFRRAPSQVIAEMLRAKLRADGLKKIVAAPIERRGKKLLAVIDDPSDLSRTDQLRMIEPDAQLQLMVGFRDEIVAFIEHSYGLVSDAEADIVVDVAPPEPAGEKQAAEAVEGLESDGGIVRLANQIIVDALRRRASDIHIEPNGRDRNTLVRFRVDGDCMLYQEVPPEMWAPLVARFKIMANLDISEHRRPQDGKIRMRLPEGQVELRVATLPTANGNEDVVLRILAASKPMPLDQMGLAERNLREMKALINKPYGLILCVGPTGSGKTTTLHSALGAINTLDTKIWTAEDPVEITQPGLRQLQVHPKIGLTFAAAMRSFLRADPDVIMVGEMRDQETAAIAVEASLTGHLVLSTLHTNSAPETVTRLLDMGLDPFTFADALLGVLAQRLARGLCQSCCEQYAGSEAEYRELAALYGEKDLVERLGVKPGPDFKLWRAKGCQVCGQTGYKGRVALHELLVGTDEMKAAIQRRATIAELRDLAIRQGMTTLLQDGVEKTLAGLTDLRQVLTVCSR
ncbi:MAG: GspE/PulE family protein [Myxococcales bacterium]|jgi:type II secretory ATPase GspE/PulE/Tfp pilus assembly ATPase PilB-like protein